MLRSFSLSLLLLLLISACAKIKLDKPEQTANFFTVKWSKNLDPYYESGNLPITVGGITLTDDYIACGSLSGSFYVFDREDGRVLWEAQEKKAINSTPFYHDDLFYYGTQAGRFVVREAVTGKLKYSIDLGAPIESKPVFSDGRLIIYLRGHQIVSLDAATGKMLWSYRRAIAIPTTLQKTARPLIVGNKIIVGFADGFVGALSREEGVILWETKIADTAKFIDVDLNPLRFGQFIVTGSPSGDLHVLDPENGAIKQTFPYKIASHPIEKNGLLVVGTIDGDLVYLNSKGEAVKKLNVARDAINNILFWKNFVILSSFDGTLYAVDPGKMQIIEKFNLGSKQSAIFSDIEFKDELAFLTSRNRLFVIK